MSSLLALALSLAPSLVAPTAAQSTAPDYTRDATWLCRPGRSDACTVNQDVTVIRADGTRKIERFVADARPAFDCFYVYPTVSMDDAPNSDMAVGAEERAVAASQAARFRRHCRVFAPMYRQVTLKALRAGMMGGGINPDRAMAYADVKAAWDDYLARDNRGRGVVLIGHSQGSGIIKLLLAREIEGKAVQARIVSALIPGTLLAVPAGADVGGDLKVMPLCRSGDQTGCVVSYVTFRADSPPPADSRFVKAPVAGQLAACANPAALTGGTAVTRAILGATGAGLTSQPAGPWTRDGAAVTTSFVAVPGLISAECVMKDAMHYLAVTVNADPADPRTDTIVGDVSLGGTILKDWGLHLIDMPVEMGDLVALSDRQARAWRKANARRPAR